MSSWNAEVLSKMDQQVLIEADDMLILQEAFVILAVAVIYVISFQDFKETT
jgi:hypothetical protein